MEECHVAIKKIMVALDLSDYSESTYTYAVTLARSLGAELILINVINSRGLETLDRLSAQGYDISRERYVSETKQNRQETFDKEYLPRAGSVPVRLIFKEGLPWEEILKAIKAEGADFIVIGTKGRNALEHVLFGSTATKVNRHAPCTVVSVRGPEHCRIPLAS
jgi:nucleotide-binding universal stress UspA family protein